MIIFNKNSIHILKKSPIKLLLLTAAALIVNCKIIYGQVNVDFEFSPNNSCSGTEISFTNLTTGSGNINYLWEFGDGNTSTQTNPTHTYNAPAGNGSQNYSVRLTATQGQEDYTVTKSVSVLRPPDTSLTDPDNWPAFSKCTGDGDFELTIVNSSISNNSEYHIDWGDGSAPFITNEFSTVSHIYSDQGLYELSFTVTGENGCIENEVYEVLYGSNPAIGVTGPEGSVGCAPISLTYEITGVDGNIGTEYIFFFDDGTDEYIFTQEDVPSAITHEFTEASCGGSDDYFTLVARAENQCGYQQITVEPISIDQEPQAVIFANDTVCVNDPITFHNHSEPPCGGNPNLTTFIWFIDGNEYDVGSSTASQTYTFDTPGVHTVSLRATNSTVSHCNGGVNQVYFDIIVVDSEEPAPPEISGPSSVCQGEQGITLTATEVDYADEYIWNLPDGMEIISGDGTNTIVVNFSETIDTGEIEITVTGANFCNEGEASEVFEIIVEPLPENPGSINGLPTICQGQEVTLRYEVDPINYADTYHWQVPANSQIVSDPDHFFIDVLFPENAESGAITVYGENSCGFGPESVRNVVVAPIPDDAGEIFGPDELCSGENATYQAEPIAYAENYIWLLEDEIISFGSSDTVFVLFDEPGVFEISVFAENACGEGGPAIKEVLVHPGPEPNLAPVDHCFGQAAIFTDPEAIPDENIDTWFWDFGDGYSSTLPEPTHTYSNIGEFLITLEVTSYDGCTAFTTDTIVVHDIPISRFRAQPDTVFVGQEVQFIDESFLLHDSLLHADAWFYDFGDTTYSHSQHPFKSYSYPGTFNVMQEVNIEIEELEEGCPDRSFLDVVVVIDVFMPNAFTPGGGGAGGGDDVLTFGPILGGDWIIPGDDMDVKFELAVFNRWGERVFYEVSFEPRWDGTIRGGPNAPQGIYVWRLLYRDAQGKQVVHTGNVMLLR